MNRIRRLSLCLLVLTQIACGGGGGSRSSSPTSPPTPGPTLTASTLFGTIVGLLEGTASFAGSKVLVLGVGETEVSSDNGFLLDGVPPGIHTVEVVGSMHVRRKFRFEMQMGGANELESLDVVEKNLFNRAAFDEIYRGHNYFFDNGHLHRWVEIPEFVIDKESFMAFGSKGNALLQTTLRAIDDELEVLTLGLMRDPSRRFQTGLRPTNHCSQELGRLEVQIHAEEPNDDYVGSCGACAFVGYELHQGQITLTSNAGDLAVWHEFGHLLGAGHLELAPGISVMRIEAEGRSSNFSQMDRYHLKYVYSRPADTRSPDDMSHLAPIRGRVVPSS